MSALVALVVQGLSRLPWAYTWLRPAEVLKDVVLRDDFPSLVLAALVLGHLSQRPFMAWWAMLRAPRWGVVMGESAEERSRRWKRVGMVVGGLYAGLVLVENHYHLLDWLALAPVGILLSWRTPKQGSLLRAGVEISLVVLVFTLVSYAFTVFKATLFIEREGYDAALMAAESALFGEPVHRMLHPWAMQWPSFVDLLDRIYYHLFEHMFLVSLFLVAACLHRERVEYLGALALCYLMGGVAYHLMPALGPIYADTETFAAMRRMPLVSTAFQGLLARNHLAVQAGTLTELPSYEFIACMPSLHMAHELVMLYYARHSKVFFALSLVFTGLTLVAITVLGWHYPIDAVGSLLLCVVAIVLARRVRGWLLPAWAMPPEDAPRQTREQVGHGS